MRILYLQPAELFGGAERQGVISIKHLKHLDLGCEVIPVVGPGKEICQALRSEGISDYLFCAHIPPEPTNLASIFLGQAHSPATSILCQRACQALEKIARQQQVDMIYASRTTGWVIAEEVGRRLSIPVVRRAGSRPTSKIQKLGLRLFDRFYPPKALVCNSVAVATSLNESSICPTKIIPNGVDLAQFNPSKTRPKWRENWRLGNRPIVGIAARPDPGKGFDSLPQILSTLLKAYPDLVVLIAGDSPLRAHYQKIFAQSKGLRAHVFFLGHVADMAAFYQSCDVLLLPSREHSIEGLPNAVLEAMAMRRPVVAFSVGGIAEAMQDGVHGLLAPPDDHHAFTDAVLKILRTPNLAQQFGLAARKHVMQYFSVEKMLVELVSFFKFIQAAYFKPAGLVASASSTTPLVQPQTASIFYQPTQR